MFGFGFSELMVIAIVALVVLGPERLPKAARFAGLWVRRARNQWDSVKQELERELHAEELKREMQSLRQTVQDTDNELRASGEAARRQMQDAQTQAHALADEVRAPVGGLAEPSAAAAPLAPTAAGVPIESTPDSTPIRDVSTDTPAATETATVDDTASSPPTEPRP